jgi:ABC-2 type transport system permease protein
MMKTIVREILKHVRLYFTLVKFSIMAQMEYRTNFVTGILMEIGYTFMKVLYVYVIYKSGKAFAGFRAEEILLYSGTFITATAFYTGMFVMNFLEMREHIRQGTLDLFMVKPVSLQFLLSLRRADPGMFVTDLATGVAITTIAWNLCEIPATIVTIGGYVLFLVLGVVVGYALFLVPQLLTFWFVRASSLFDVADAFWDFNIMPMVSYNRIVQAVGLVVIPIFMVTNLPPLFVTGKLHPLYIVLGFSAPVVFLTLTRLFFRVALKRYNSTGS